MNWRTVSGLSLILVGVLLFVNVNHVYHVGYHKSYPLTAFLICSCPIVVGSIIMNNGRKKNS